MTDLDRWLAPQNWTRDDGPCISLGAAGAFDDTHVFCPAVIFEDGRYRIWYAGRCDEIHEHKYFAVGTATWSPGD